MHDRFPIEQLASSQQTRFQSGFARMAMYLLPALEDVAYEPTNTGLRILAEDPMALARPAGILRDIYGNDVRLGTPRVRMMRDAEGVKEPVMNVRVAVPADSHARVLDDLLGRTALVQEVDLQPAGAVIRAQAPLRSLLGYEQTLATLTGNTAELWMWLSHYDRLPTGPDGDAA